MKDTEETKNCNHKKLIYIDTFKEFLQQFDELDEDQVMALNEEIAFICDLVLVQKARWVSSRKKGVYYIFYKSEFPVRMKNE